MLLGVTVLIIMGLPPIAELPLIGPYIRNDAARYMRRHNIVLGRALGSPQINPLLPARIICWLKLTTPSLAHRLAKDLYRAHWGLDQDISKIEIVSSLLNDHNIDQTSVQDALDNGNASRHCEMRWMSPLRMVYLVLQLLELKPNYFLVLKN